MSSEGAFSEAGLTGHLQAVRALVDHLQVEADEEAVATLIASRRDTGWQLCFGSLLIGPPAMTQVSWPEWEAAERPGPGSIIEALQNTTRPARTWRRFDESANKWRFVRFPLSLTALEVFLGQALAGASVIMPRGAAPLQMHVRPADALVRVFPHREVSPAGRLLAGVARPVTGWVHPLSVAVDEGETDLDSSAIPPDGPLRAPWVPNSTLWLTGVATGGTSTPAPPSLFVGRVQREAWFAAIRGGRPALETFDIDLGLDPQRVSPGELQIDLEESNHGGDLLHARRVWLGDLRLPEHGYLPVSVRLPTLGAGVVRSLRLYHRDGRLLDAAENIVIAESIHLSIAVGSTPTITSVVAAGLPAPTLVRRLGALERVDAEHQQMLAEGVAGRVIVTRAEGRAVLRERLRAARGQLRVADPYFGRVPKNPRQPEDWQLLEKVPVSVRVLGHQALRRPSTWPQGAPDLQIRRWGTGVGAPPFHDRTYTWDGGGLTVGTSANGLGGRLTLISPLDPALSTYLANCFEQWWNDPHFIEVPVKRSPESK